MSGQVKAGGIGKSRFLVTDDDGALKVVPVTSADSGDALSPYLNEALDATPDAVKATAGTFHGGYIYNPNTDEPISLHLYNVAVGGVTVGTTPPTQSFRVDNGAVFELQKGIYFDTAITVAATQQITGGDTDPTIGLVVNLWFK